jgi:hypothetical protein
VQANAEPDRSFQEANRALTLIFILLEKMWSVVPPNGPEF